MNLSGNTEQASSMFTLSKRTALTVFALIRFTPKTVPHETLNPMFLINTEQNLLGAAMCLEEKKF